MPSPLSLALVLCLFGSSLVSSYRTGTPGVDYPNYLRAPRTSFQCRGRGNGYFSDPEAGCQAYHVCDNGRKYSFVCPVTTLFSDSIKTCDYWYNVQCSGAQSQPDPVIDERPVDRPNPVDSEPYPEEPAAAEPGQPVEEPEPDREPEESFVVHRPDPSANVPQRPGPPNRPVFTPRPTAPAEEPVYNGEEEENFGNEAEGSENRPDVIPSDPMHDTVPPADWRSGRDANSRQKSKSWTTFSHAATTTAAPPKWQTFEGNSRSSVGSEPAATDNSVNSDQSLKRKGTTSTTPASTTTSEPEPETTKFRKENWMEQGMPEPVDTNESNADNKSAGNEIGNVSQHSRGAHVRTQRQEGDPAPDENGMIGSMMKWAAAASSALSLRQKDPKVVPVDAGDQYSVPKGPNPYIPDDQRRYHSQRRTQGSGVTTPLPAPSPPTEAPLNPPYAYPYEPVNPSVANDRVHVSLNERRVYDSNRGPRSNSHAGKRSALPVQTVDHPNPWTFPMTEQETAQEAAKPRDTYRARRRDDPTGTDHPTRGASKTGSAFDMAEDASTLSPKSTTAPFVNSVTERLPEPEAQTVTTSKPSSFKKRPTGNFMTGEIMSNGQCRCPIPDSDVYFS